MDVLVSGDNYELTPFVPVGMRFYRPKVSDSWQKEKIAPNFLQGLCRDVSKVVSRALELASEDDIKVNERSLYWRSPIELPVHFEVGLHRDILKFLLQNPTLYRYRHMYKRSSTAAEWRNSVDSLKKASTDDDVLSIARDIDPLRMAHWAVVEAIENKAIPFFRDCRFDIEDVFKADLESGVQKGAHCFSALTDPYPSDCLFEYETRSGSTLRPLVDPEEGKVQIALDGIRNWSRRPAPVAQWTGEAPGVQVYLNPFRELLELRAVPQWQLLHASASLPDRVQHVLPFEKPADPNETSKGSDSVPATFSSFSVTMSDMDVLIEEHGNEAVSNAVSYLGRLDRGDLSEVLAYGGLDAVTRDDHEDGSMTLRFYSSGGHVDPSKVRSILRPGLKIVGLDFNFS
jgi:hypothetical protein